MIILAGDIWQFPETFFIIITDVPILLAPGIESTASASTIKSEQVQNVNSMAIEKSFPKGRMHQSLKKHLVTPYCHVHFKGEKIKDPDE